MNLIDLRIFSTQLMLYLKTSCHLLTTHINGLHLGSEHLCRGTCINFIKTISEGLLNQTIDHKASLIFFQLCTDSSVTDQDAILLRKVHPDTHEPATVFASIKCLKETGQAGFCPDK
jgi:hypothetical protein